MRRRTLVGSPCLWWGLAWSVPASAIGLQDLTQADASAGLRTALETGANQALQVLGRKDGFWGNDRVRIPLPPALQDASSLMRTLGQGQRVDELLEAMNRAAEEAVPLAKGLLLNAVKKMTVNDAKAIVSGGGTAVTDFFAEKTRAALTTQFLPVVSKVTSKVGLAEKYNQVAGRAQQLGLVKGEDANIERYVTSKSLDALYMVIGEEEKKIRANPVAYGSSVLTKVFGAIR